MRALNRDMVAGPLLILIGGFFAIYAYRTLPMGTAFRMGPGFFPVWVGALLALFGAAILARGFLKDGETIGVAAWRAAAMVTLALVGFGLLIRGLGLIGTLVVTGTIAGFASRRMTLTYALLLSGGLAIFCALLFGYALQLSVPLVGDWLR